MVYNGTISGTGESRTRENEITADDIATFRARIFGFDYGVIDIYNPFFAEVNGNEVKIGKGMMFAYGYIGYLPKSIVFSFNKTAAVQYHFIYAEINKSVIPNTFKIKTKNNQASNLIKPTTFRQDVLSSVKTGIFQLPLYLVELGINGIVSLTNIAEQNFLYAYPKKSMFTGIADCITENVHRNVELSTQPPYTDNSELVASTLFTHLAIRHYIDDN